MGVLADRLEDDVALMQEALEFSKWVWDRHCAKHSEETRRFDINVEHLESLSRVADVIYKEHFANPSMYERVATFLILVNSSALIRVYQRGGRPVTNIQEFRAFVGRLSIVFSNAALRCWGRDGEKGCYVIKSLLDDYSHYLFLSFLEKIESVEVTMLSAPSSRRKDELQHALRSLAKDIYSATNFLYPKIEFVVGDDTSPLLGSSE